MNHKKLFRIYRDERLTVRNRGGRKRALGTRMPMMASAIEEPTLVTGLRIGCFDQVLVYFGDDRHPSNFRRTFRRPADTDLDLRCARQPSKDVAILPVTVNGVAISRKTIAAEVQNFPADNLGEAGAGRHAHSSSANCSCKRLGAWRFHSSRKPTRMSGSKRRTMRWCVLSSSAKADADSG